MISSYPWTKLFYLLFLICLLCFIYQWINFSSTYTGLVPFFMRNRLTRNPFPKCQPHLQELQFPLAFSILVYTNGDRALRLLRAIHRRTNFYCVHIDIKASQELRQSIEGEIQRQYGPEVYVIPEAESLDVRWGEMSALDADLLCSRILLQRYPSWLYWINLTGQEFPLKTNWELVTALRLLNHSNAIAATYKGRIISRLPPSHNLPFQFLWYKGSVHIAATRDFVQFMHTDVRAIQLLALLRQHEIQGGIRTIPDETYFATLNHNPKTFPIPGAFLGKHELLRLMLRYKQWQDLGDYCGSGHWVRDICMFGWKDLPLLKSHYAFFANKFIPEVEPEAYDALEQWLADKTKYECVNNRLHPSFNRTYYSSLELSWNHL